MTLVFGCRRPEEDHLYWEEMLEMARKGVLHEVHTAYSRLPDQPKVNTTTVRVERAEHLKNRLWWVSGSPQAPYFCEPSPPQLQNRGKGLAWCSRG